MTNGQSSHPGNTPPAGTAGFDESPVNVGGTFQFFGWFFLSLVAIVLILWFFGPIAANWASTQYVDTHQLSRVPPLQPSPGHPELPGQDMAELRAAQERRLHSAGPAPGEPNHRHIPIDQAMDQLLQSGALTRPWKNPTTYPYQRPPGEKAPAAPILENRT